jgi:hypothetical protein
VRALAKNRAATHSSAQEAKDRQRLAYMKVPKKERVKEQDRQRYALTTSGVYRLGVKQSLGYASTRSTCSILDVPVCRQTVARCEHMVCASRVAATRQWYERMYEILEGYCRAFFDLAEASGFYGSITLKFDIRKINIQAKPVRVLASGCLVAQHFRSCSECLSQSEAYSSSFAGSPLGLSRCLGANTPDAS